MEDVGGLGRARWWRSWLALALVAVLASACGGGETDSADADDEESTPSASEDSSPTAEDPEAEPEPEPVTLSLWYTFPEPFGPSMEELATICTERLPNVTIETEAVGADYAELDQRVQAAIAAGDPPDLSMQGLEKTELLATSDAALDLEPLIEADSEFDVAPIEPFLRLARGANGKQVGVPWGTSVPVLYWNKTHFEDAGLDPEVPPSTFEEMLEFADALKDTGSGRVGLAFDYQLPNNYVVPAILAQSGAGMVEDGELAFASDRAKEVLEALTGSAANGAVGTYPDYAGIAQAFKTEQASMMLFASTTGPAWAKEMTSEFGTARIPYGFGHDGEYEIFAAGNMWVVHSKDEAKQRAAWELLKCFVSPEGAKVAVLKNGYLPTNPASVEDAELQALLAEEPFRETSIELVPQMQKLFAFGGDDGRRAAEIYRDAWVTALNGDVSPAESLDRALGEIAALPDITY